jgi:hypothetical protein
MRTIAVIVTAVAAALALAGCTTPRPSADPASDAPEGPRSSAAASYAAPQSYREALATWQGAEDVNAWIAARFEYDRARALLLSETQRQRNGQLPIEAPERFFENPQGVCVDLARFAVETLRAVDPASRPTYVMIEFDPLSISGNVLRRHWVVAFERDGRRYVFADSKRPGHVAGPYASLDEFIAAYAAWRGRPIVAFREANTYQRRLRAPADKRVAESRP